MKKQSKPVYQVVANHHGEMHTFTATDVHSAIVLFNAVSKSFQSIQLFRDGAPIGEPFMPKQTPRCKPACGV